MNFIKGLSIKNKLLLITLLPLIIVVYFLTTTITEEIKYKNNTLRTLDSTIKVQRISKLIHEIQLERSHSVSYVASKEKEVRSQLFIQRNQTDAAVVELNQRFKSHGLTTVNIASLIEEIPHIRNAVNRIDTDADSIENAYSKVIRSLIDTVNNTNLITREPEIKNHFYAHMSLLYGKEYFGLIRTNIGQALRSGSFNEKDCSNFIILKGKFEFNMEKFRDDASEALQALYDKKMENYSNRLTKDMIDAVAFSRLSLPIDISQLLSLMRVWLYR